MMTIQSAAMTDEQIEAGASALVDSCIAKGHWQHASDESKAIYREHAKAVLRAALAARPVTPASAPEALSGYKLMPIEPTPEIIAAMAIAWQKAVAEDDPNECVAEYRAALAAPTPGAPEALSQITDALTDILSGWKYIRSFHGDLYGVGWDRAQAKAEKALELLAALSEDNAK